MKCQLAGAGMVLFFWVIGFVVEAAFEKELGLYAGFPLWAFLLVGIWFGYEVMQQCRKSGRPPVPPSS